MHRGHLEFWSSDASLERDNMYNLYILDTSRSIKVLVHHLIPTFRLSKCISMLDGSRFARRKDCFGK